MTITSVRPSDFVRHLIRPGLGITGAGPVPLAQYVCAVEAFGGSKNAESVITAVSRNIPLDPARRPGPGGVLSADNKISFHTRNIGRMMTGQGYPSDFILVMEHIAKNLDAVKKLVIQPWTSIINPEGKRVSARDGAPRSIEKIFGYNGSRAADYLNAMVEKKVFGLDCIGFVSQYLVHAGIWQEYKPYYPKDYTREFKPITSLRQIKPLSVLIWGNFHIALVEAVKSFEPNPENPTSVTIDVCQSSSGGPQMNLNVILEPDGDHTYNSHRLFRIRNRDRMPVNSPVYVGVMNGLTWQGDPEYHTYHERVLSEN